MATEFQSISKRLNQRWRYATILFRRRKPKFVLLKIFVNTPPDGSILSILQCRYDTLSKGAFRLGNFVKNFLVAPEKLPGNLQARAIISTRRGWIFIAWIFIARNYLPSVCSFIEGGCGTLSIHLLSFLKGSDHYLNSCLYCSVYKVVISIGSTNTV